jgi:hypothetical protein
MFGVLRIKIIAKVIGENTHRMNKYEQHLLNPKPATWPHLK